MREFYYRNRPAIHKFMLLSGFFAFLLVLNLAFSYIAPFVVAIIISLILNPIVGLLQRKLKIHRGISGALLIIICILIIIVLGTLAVSRIAYEASGFMDEIPYHIVSIQALFDDMVDRLEVFTGLYPGEFGALFGNVTEQIFLFIISLLQTGVERGTVGLITVIPGVLLRVMLTIISAFFFIKDKDLIRRSVANLMPDRFKNRIIILKKGVFSALAAYAKGQLIIMCIVATICILVLTIIGAPYSMLIGLGIAVFDLIPVVGAGWILMPWAVYNLLMGNFSFAVGLLVTYGLIFLTRQLIEPKILAGKIGIHPILLLMSVYIGIQAVGPFGLLIGPFVMIIVKTVIQSDMG